MELIVWIKNILNVLKNSIKESMIKSTIEIIINRSRFL